MVEPRPAAALQIRQLTDLGSRLESALPTSPIPVESSFFVQYRASRPFQNITTLLRRSTPPLAVTSYPQLPSLNTFAKEITMQNVITIGRELVPVEQIAYVEPFEPAANGQFKPDKPYKGRVVLLNRETVLTETAPQEFAEAHGFRLLPEDNVATNPLITFRVASFVPTQDFDHAPSEHDGR
jgi:hypothetical protein